MKKRLLNLAGVLITTALALAFIMYLGYRLDPPFTQGAMDAIDAFHELPENSQDVIVYGSSHAWKGCDPIPLEEKCGLSSYNYGCNWQALNTTLLFLEDSFRTQSPRYVLIDTYRVGYIKENTDLDGEIYYTRRISFFEGKRDYLKQCFGHSIGKYINYYLPLTVFHENWTEIAKENFSKPNLQKWKKTRGFSANSDVEPFEFPDPAGFEQEELAEKSIKVLDKIVEICHENGAELIFFTCPWAGEYSFGDAMEKYAAEKGCQYLNLFQYVDEIGLDGKTDLQDEGHLNSSGAAKVGGFLGNYIKENYNV